ncbi:HTH_Tnp_Tc3_2 domain-containing protein [Trichonephila clavipes]|nr:HTH_Tnp_Tc3_2 domain-containing protein [Trichonephila clavipes]
MFGGQKTSNRANCKGELVLTVCEERQLRRIVRSQTLAQIITQLNDDASRKVNKRIVQRSLHGMHFGSRRPTRVPLLNARYRVACLVRGLGSNPREGRNICKCIVPSRHGDILNSRRAANPLVRLTEQEERWIDPLTTPGVFFLKIGVESSPNDCHLHGA